MKRNIQITLNAGHEYFGVGSDKMQLITQGILYERDDSYNISYDDSDITGEEDTSMLLRIKSDNTADLIRYGGENLHFTFEEGRMHYTSYKLPVGYKTIGVFTEKLSVIKDEDEGGFEILITYQLEFDDSRPFLKNTLRFIIKEAKN